MDFGPCHRDGHQIVFKNPSLITTHEPSGFVGATRFVKDDIDVSMNEEHILFSTSECDVFLYRVEAEKTVTASVFFHHGLMHDGEPLEREGTRRVARKLFQEYECVFTVTCFALATTCKLLLEQISLIPLKTISTRRVPETFSHGKGTLFGAGTNLICHMHVGHNQVFPRELRAVVWQIL